MTVYLAHRFPRLSSLCFYFEDLRDPYAEGPITLLPNSPCPTECSISRLHDRLISHLNEVNEGINAESTPNNSKNVIWHSKEPLQIPFKHVYRGGVRQSHKCPYEYSQEAQSARESAVSERHQAAELIKTPRKTLGKYPRSTLRTGSMTPHQAIKTKTKTANLGTSYI